MKRGYEVWLADLWYTSKKQQTLQVRRQLGYFPIERATGEAHSFLELVWNRQAPNSTTRALWVPPQASEKHHLQAPSCAGAGGASGESIRWRRQLHWSPCAVSLVFPAIHEFLLPMTKLGLTCSSGDGWFVKALPENVRSIVSQIGRVVESRQMSPPDVTPIDRYRLGLQQCLELSKTNNMTIVFMATDARFPRMNKAFAPLWNQYPCTFTIEDILPSDSPHWQILDAVKDPRTGGSLRKFLLPLVDASVAGRGWFFIGSEGSTFSGYIYRLHDVFWSDNEKQRLSQDASSSPWFCAFFPFSLPSTPQRTHTHNFLYSSSPPRLSIHNKSNHLHYSLSRTSPHLFSSLFYIPFIHLYL